MTSAELTLDGLVAAVADELDERAITPTDPRATERPDGRTLRYYTTLGLLDPPLAHRQRRAVYGRRHVRQAVAIKRLQADGATLAEIQSRLAGLDDRALEKVAAEAGNRSTTRDRARRRERFWSTDASPASSIEAALPSVSPGNAKPPVSLVAGFDVTRDVTLLVRGDMQWMDDPAVRDAARALARTIANARARIPMV